MDRSRAKLEPRPLLRLLSLVLPFYNEEEVVPHLRGKLEDTVSRLPCDAEFVLVDDGSRDGPAGQTTKQRQIPTLLVSSFSVGVLNNHLALYREPARTDVKVPGGNRKAAKRAARFTYA